MTMRLTLGCFLCLAACGGRPGADATTGVVHQAARDHQGPDLQGGSAEDAYTFLPGGSVSGTDPVGADGLPFDGVSVRYGDLKAERGGTVWDGTQLTGATFHGINQRSGAALTFQITEVDARTTSFSGAPEFEYQIKVTDGATGVTTGLCDPSTGNRAVPTPGWWDLYGQANAASTRFTFVCLSGVVEKCNRWGYHSWDPTYATYHQACTRMARADYCGDGLSHTVSGTLIDYYDLNGVTGVPGFVAPDPAGATLFFEAGWRPKGTAVCLSKLRWATLPLGGYCPLSLPDPRVVSGKKDPRARYCEDYGDPGSGAPFLETLSSQGAMTFDNSAYIDSGLYTWNDSSSGQRFTTTQGFYSAVGGSVPPAPGYLTAAYEGAVYSASVDPSLLPAGVLGLDLWTNARGHHLTTTLDATALGYHRVRREGYIYPRTASPEGGVKLSLYLCAFPLGFLTTTRTPPASCFLLNTEGFLPH